MSDNQKLYERYKRFELLVDSRRLNEADKTLFFALPGAKNDGHEYIEDLLRQGVRHFVVREDYWIKTFEQPDRVAALSLYTEATFIAVDDVLETLQSLAATHRQQYSGQVIAITGSNGKTIVKDWLTALLKTKYSVCASPRSYNSQIGVPLSIWQIQQHHQIAVIEAGVSEAGEMQRLQQIIAPTHGIFTNLGEAHAAGFQSMSHKLQEKLSLFTCVKFLLIAAKDQQIINQAKAMMIAVETCQSANNSLESTLSNAPIEVSSLPDLPAIFRHDALLAVAMASAFGIAQENFNEVLPTFRPLEMRLQVRSGRNGCSIINDSYSNDLTSLAAALDFALTQAPAERLTLILSDLAQTGTSSKITYKRVAELLTGKVHNVFAVGPEIELLGTLLADKAINFYYYQSSNALAEDLSNFGFREETILLKGARSFALEKLVDTLTSRRHRTLLEVDLDAMLHNLMIYRQQLPATTGIAAMVKASAYGSGSVQVARMLADAGALYLIVAYTDEGIALREANVEAPIMVLNPEQSEYELLATHQLEPIVADLSSLNRLLKAFPQLPLHLEFDTGMGRLGFQETELDEVIALLKTAERNPKSVFTHLAASDSALHDAFTHNQINRFNELVEKLQQHGIAPSLRHVLNTNGISRFPEAAYEMVRLGIGLYGLEDAEKRHQLKPVAQLKAAVSGLRTITAPNTSVGYGRKGVVGTGQRIATISIGYADGLPRAAGEGQYSLLVNGHLAPIVGAVCMDMCMIDVTDVPSISIDDEVIIFGPTHPIEKLAQVVGTIPYEILTGIGPRVHRIYVRE